MVNIFTDNRKLAISLNEGVHKASEGAQDAGSLITKAIKIINELPIRIYIDQMAGHLKPKVKPVFITDPNYF